MVLWVFGYGSLIWNPGFDFDEKIIGYIKDYKRVFDLGMYNKLTTTTHCSFLVERRNQIVCLWFLDFFFCSLY